MQHGIKISVELSHQCPLDHIKAHALKLEASGFYRVWVPDTLVSPWEAWLAASIVAQNTKKIQIGLGVTNPFTRHPVVMAQMALTLHQFSENRLSISLGKGIARFLEKAGIDPNPAGEEECMMILRELMTGEKVSFQGKAFRLDGIRLRTLPPASRVSLYKAAVGLAGWERALETADGVVTFWNPEAGWIRRSIVARKPMHTAAMIPFSLSGGEFMAQTVKSLEDLRKQIIDMEEAEFDEAIIAYRDMGDLEAAASLIRA